MSEKQSQDTPKIQVLSMLSVWLKLKNSLDLSPTASDCLYYFLINLHVSKGGWVSLREVRRDGEDTYATVIKKSTRQTRRALLELSEKGVIVTDEVAGKSTKRSLSNDAVNMLLRLISGLPTPDMDVPPSNARRDTDVPPTPDMDVPPPRTWMSPRSNIEGTGLEELANSELAGWDRQPPKWKLVELAKEFEGHFADGFMPYLDNLDWFEKAIRVTDMQTIKDFVTFSRGYFPRGSHGFTKHNREVLWAAFMSSREQVPAN